jgi:DNA-binding beta-propeller fold protein YncE
MVIPGPIIDRSYEKEAGHRIPHTDSPSALLLSRLAMCSLLPHGVTARRWGFCLCLLLTLVVGSTRDLPHATAGTAVATIAVDQEPGISGMVIDEHTGHLFIATTPHMQAFDTSSWVTMVAVRSGTVLRHTPVGLGEPLLTFDPRLDRVYVTGLVKIAPRARPSFPSTLPTTRPLIEALDGASGDIVGTATLSSQGMGFDVDIPLGHLFVTGGGGSSCTQHTCTTEPSIVTMLDARTLKVLAVTPVGNSPQRDLLVDNRNGRVYVSTIDGVDVLDAGTGKHLLRIPLPARILGVDAVTNRVFLADTSGDLLLLDGRTSEVLFALPTALSPGYDFPGATLAVDLRQGHLYYAAARPSAKHRAPVAPLWLYEADGVTGRVIHGCPIAAHPSAVAAAPGNGLAIVTDYSTDTVTVLRIASCSVVQRVRVGYSPREIAVDEANSLMIIESRVRQYLTSTSENPLTPTSTLVAIIRL